MNKPTLFLIGFFLVLTSCEAYVKITSSESDAKVFVNGNYTTDGSVKITLPDRGCQTVKMEKTGFLPIERKYCFNVSGFPKPPQTDYYSMQKDESWDASVKTDLANVDFAIEVDKKYNEDQAWKVISQVVTNYFDDIVTSSKETGYLITAWKVQSFPKRTVRTRIVIKNSNSNPLTYKIKIASEIALDENVSVKNEEQFKEWDRVLKRYEGVISEFQVRLGSK
jgi:hypothetical protein